MSNEQIIDLVRENERLKGALRACRSYAEQSLWGRWRHTVASICNNALKGRA